MLHKALQTLLLLFWITACNALSEIKVPLPKDMKGEFLGIETCGSSTCHGSQTPWRNATVLMKERLIWEGHDSHSKAYKSLLSERGKQIGLKLGFREPENNPQCLQCHSTFVPTEQRGENFLLESGVSCESCHGAGGNFLSTHVYPDSNHQKNVAAGMYPTDNPINRSKLCLSCHQAGANNNFNHKLYGAGHPRLRFELETYSVNLPYHFKYDADYKRRKRPVKPVYSWAFGQIESTLALLYSLEKTIKNSIYIPDLANFECFSCHRNISSETTITRHHSNFGTPSVNAANIIMLRALADTIPSENKKLHTFASQLQEPVHSKSKTLKAIAGLQSTINLLKASLNVDSDAIDGMTIISNITKYSILDTSISYSEAEMIAMSISALAVADLKRGLIDNNQFKSINQDLDELYENLEHEKKYTQSMYRRALSKFATNFNRVASK